MLLLLLATAFGHVPVFLPAGPDDWCSVLNDQLTPGDYVVLQGGVYSDSCEVAVGPQDMPGESTTLMPLDPYDPPIFRPDGSSPFILRFSGEHLTVYGVSFEQIPAGVTGLGDDVFSACVGLTSITIPSSVTSIGECAFYGCSRLIAAYFLGDAPELEDDVFSNVDLGFAVYYLSGRIGYSSPIWEGFPAFRIGQAPALSLSPIASISASQAGMRLTIRPTSGRTIGVEYSSDMSPGSWIELGNFFPADGVLEFTDADFVRRARPSGYYRAFLRPEMP